jgi:hypothetical protein
MVIRALSVGMLMCGIAVMVMVLTCRAIVMTTFTVGAARVSVSGGWNENTKEYNQCQKRENPSC